MLSENCIDERLYIPKKTVKMGLAKKKMFSIKMRPEAGVGRCRLSQTTWAAQSCTAHCTDAGALIGSPVSALEHQGTSGSAAPALRLSCANRRWSARGILCAEAAWGLAGGGRWDFGGTWEVAVH